MTRDHERDLETAGLGAAAAIMTMLMAPSVSLVAAVGFAVAGVLSAVGLRRLVGRALDQ